VRADGLGGEIGMSGVVRTRFPGPQCAVNACSQDENEIMYLGTSCALQSRGCLGTTDVSQPDPFTF
jgi:hypothetical protein